MATNQLLLPGWYQLVACSNPTTPASNDPVRFGFLTGVAMTDEDTDGNTSVYFGPGDFNLSVKGVDDSGNSAVAVGDALFYVDADTPKLSKKVSGYFFGVAMATVGSGSTGTVQVHHCEAPGSGALASSAVTTTKIAANAVTAAKLTATLRTGYIPLPLTAAREISSNDIINTAGDAGMLSSNTTPKLYRENGATDKKLLVEWAASNSDEIAWDISYPPDLDDTAAVVVNLLMLMSGATDTPTVAVSYFEGIGDTNAGGNTAALGSSLAQKTVTIASGDIGAYPAGASIGIVVGAHTTDKAQLLGAWIEYTRK